MNATASGPAELTEIISYIRWISGDSGKQGDGGFRISKWSKSPAIMCREKVHSRTNANCRHIQKALTCNLFISDEGSSVSRSSVFRTSERKINTWSFKTYQLIHIHKGIQMFVEYKNQCISISSNQIIHKSLTVVGDVLSWQAARRVCFSSQFYTPLSVAAQGWLHWKASLQTCGDIHH